ncbi:MAG: alcohol dehydrogenase catalytic domain-containing protein, partial [Rhodospirillaceae bacterium]
MSADQFTCLLLESEDGKKVSASIQTLGNDRLPKGDVTVAVKYSTLNYKDGMIVNGLGRLVRDYPHVPGIDFCGVVEESASPDYKPGDEVILTGWRVGEIHWGGFAQRARVKSDWLVPLPAGLTLKQSMAIGTAGFTAMLAVMTLEAHGLTPATDKDV